MKSLAKAPIVGRYHDGKVMRIGNPIHVANPSEKTWSRHRYLFSFSCGLSATFILAYGNCMSDALEDAAELCVEMEWFGHCTPPEKWDPADGDPWAEDSGQIATDSGFVSSECLGCEENPSNARLRAIWKRD